mmetsp:Transcript_38584/g.84681  ORF Transcript_38584/g.84681 Transcript_38584/m.84681 type:complete len:202 (+) Transcript_38584:1-606(+)
MAGREWRRLKVGRLPRLDAADGAAVFGPAGTVVAVDAAVSLAVGAAADSDEPSALTPSDGTDGTPPSSAMVPALAAPTGDPAAGSAALLLSPARTYLAITGLTPPAFFLAPGDSGPLPPDAATARSLLHLRPFVGLLSAPLCSFSLVTSSIPSLPNLMGGGGASPAMLITTSSCIPLSKTCPSNRTRPLFLAHLSVPTRAS